MNDTVLEVTQAMQDQLERFMRDWDQQVWNLGPILDRDARRYLVTAWEHVADASTCLDAVLSRYIQ
jgi:hypothetical protein